MSSIRLIFSVDDAPEVDTIITETPILQIIYQILMISNTASPSTEEEEQVYHLKLEALWLLTNLAATNIEDSMMLILVS